MKFVVIDFETANRSRSSACEIGMVKIEDGQIVDTFDSLIKPHKDFDQFEAMNVMVHGIQAKDVKNAPEFNEIWGDIVRFIGDGPVVAHNAAFDLGILRSTAALYELELPTIDVYCTLVLSRKLISLVSYSLPWVASELEIPFEHEHRAQNDAKGTAEVALALLRRANIDSLLELAAQNRVAPGRISPLSYSSTHSLRSSAKSFQTKAEMDAYFANLKPDDLLLDDDFRGKEVIFTGKLMSMTREEAQKLVMRAGGRTGPGVTKSTSMLVFGQQDASQLKPGAERSSKFEKALKLLESGQPIEVIDENTFLELLEE
jgi:DNA polymerase-3 subunit epsilon